MDLRANVRAELDTGYEDGLELDVAVVGGGVSGLYTAYRLMTGETETGEGYDPGDVQVFELSERIGGRLESIHLPGIEIAGDIGGMRYLPSQRIVTALVEDVFDGWLDHEPFSMGDPANHLRYFRKQRFHADAWTEAQKKGEEFETRYHLDPDDEGLSSDQLFNKIVYEVLDADPWVREHYGEKLKNPDKYTYEIQLDREEWDHVKKHLTYNFSGPYEGMRVDEMGFWNLIEDRASHEGYEFLADAGGYFSNTVNWNAAEAFPSMVGDFSSDPEYRTITGGYDLVAYALAYAFLDRYGGTIRAENGLNGFARNDGDGPRYELTVYNEAADAEWTAYADELVLAMPRHSIELLDQDSLVLGDEEFQHNLDSVIVQPSFKVFMGFESAWWESKLGAKAGESVTDLPMRQCYYWGVDEADSHSMFLASYNDMRTVQFWSVLEDGDPAEQGFQPRPTELATEEDLADVEPHQAPKPMVDELMRQVRELHGDSAGSIPEPYVTYYRDWSKDPFGGGYHEWKAGYDVEDVMQYMRLPDPSEHVYVVGEAYSDQQGWVEGALCTAEKLLQERFDATWPTWLDENYYLGW